MNTLDNYTDNTTTDNNMIHDGDPKGMAEFLQERNKFENELEKDTDEREIKE